MTFDEFSELDLDLMKLFIYELAENKDRMLYNNNPTQLPEYFKKVDLVKNEYDDIFRLCCKSRNLILINILIEGQISYLSDFLVVACDFGLWDIHSYTFN